MSNRKTMPGNDMFSAWARLATTQMEILAASSQVIAHRTTRMMFAGPNPVARDRREFVRMFSEKGDAALGSMKAAVLHATRMNQALGLHALRDFGRLASAFGQRGGGATAARAFERQLSLARSLQRVRADRATRSSMRLLHAMLDPYHARATANARRLSVPAFKKPSKRRAPR